MVEKLTERLLFPVLALSIAACAPRESGEQLPDAGMVIEVLRHGDGGPESVEELTGIAVGSGFELSGTEVMVTDRWEHALDLHETSDDNPEENHAFEISWPAPDGGEGRQWLHQGEADGAATLLDGLPVAIRVGPPGARAAGANDEAFASQVQFLHRGHHHDLPEPGGEVFDGWRLKNSRQFKSALMEQDGSISETEDAGFVNRVLEVHIVSEGGNEERHIVFLDHPELTEGIHPTILPVSRVSGETASLARLVVCRPMPKADGQHQLWVTPEPGGGGARVRIARRGEGVEDVVEVTEFPAEIPVNDELTLCLLRQFTHARAVVRWERSEAPIGDVARPALVLEHREGHQASRLVLIEGEITPCRLSGGMVMLRFRGQ